MSQAAQQPPAPGQQEGAAAPPVAPNRSARSSGCPPHVLAAIYGKQTVEQKKAALDTSLQRWWTEYADRKNDEDEYVADSLLYDRRHLPRTAPAPECVQRAMAAAAANSATAAAQPAAQQQQQAAAPSS